MNFAEYSDLELREIIARLNALLPVLILAAQTEPVGQVVDRRRLVRCNVMLAEIPDELDRRRWVRAGKQYPDVSGIVPVRRFKKWKPGQKVAA